MILLHQPSTIIGDRYRIVAPLGQGGFGTTYEAEDLTNYKRVALKAISLRGLENWKGLELFEREAKILAKLNHHAIPKYLDYFYIDTADDRRFYLIQELVGGQSFSELVKKGWYPSQGEIKEIAFQILDILEYLHQLNPAVIHRDIKPQNLIINSKGIVFLVDFGAVKDVYRNTLSYGETFVGTFGYMPPEQFQGQAFCASDLYSLGATLLFLLTHRSPADLPQQRLKIDFRGSVQISQHFADWLEKMLEPAVEDRFQSVEEAIDALRQKKSISSSLSGSIIPQRQQPAGSRIIFTKNYQRLVAEIPPCGLNGNNLLLAILILSVLKFILVWKMVTIVTFFSTVFFLEFWIIVLVLLGLLFDIAGEIYLEINRYTFKIEWQLFGLSLGQITGRTVDLKFVEVDSSVNFLGQKTITCAIGEGAQQHKFGSKLTKVEKRWLVEELRDFLGVI
ncbi:MULTISPECIES: serine/threonine-protein kinase [unclassified Moorena]|uniref:serine/threonine protein kinase n=1 Tax=unclassified Moorena TaxID=2683338 RepID=UPI0013CAEB1E|nr:MULTISPECIES: serine/threonine-protein kinase [unclassified Moorena]NEO20831.1 serine/threonine protein kinase [Moorena sp. SIO4A5]NEQ60519.1 serine/threonine protein kinase [Moorena sp. SIO4A1]